MADVLRDMLVSIDFSDIDTKKLLGIDDTMDDIVRKMGGLDSELKTTGREFDKMGDKGKKNLSDTEKKAKELREEQEKNSKKLDELKDGFGKFGSVAVKSIGAVTAAMGGLVGATGLAWAESDKAFANLEARTGYTGETLNALKGTVNDVFESGFGDNLDQVGKDVSKVQLLFDDLTNTQLANVSKGMYTISQLWDQDMETITRATKNMVDNFDGLSEMDALNLMQVAFQKTGDYSGDLLDTFNEYSGYFSDMGFSAREFANILVKGASAGAWNMDKVGDAIKELGVLAVEEGGNASKAFEAMGFDARDMANKFAMGGDTAQDAFVATIAGLSAMKDPVKQQAAGVELFGTMWEDLRGSVVLAMSDSTDAIGYYGDAIDTATVAMQDNVGTKMTQALRELKGGMVEAFDNSNGPAVLDELIDKASELGPKIAEVTTDALNLANTVIENWGAITGVLIPLAAGLTTTYVAFKAMSIVGTITSLINAYRAGTLLATAASLGLNTALLASPLGWIALGLGAVVTAGVLVYKNFDTIKEKATQLFDYIKSFTVPEWLQTLGGGISTAFKGVKNFVMGSHATGLENVPFDGYTAELHKGESVLTASQSDVLRDMGVLSANGSKPVLNPSQAVTSIAPSTGGGQTINFNPSISINLTTTPGDDDTTVTNKIKQAVADQLESFFRQMNLQIN